MFPRAALLAACAGLALFGAVPTGAVYVTSLPTDADVWLDGTYVGHSPVVIDALAAGRHTVSLNRTGWASQDVDVSVVAGKTALSCIALVRAATAGLGAGSGTFVLHGAGIRSVLLDGAPMSLQKSNVYHAPSGEHELVLQVDGGKMTRTITVYPDLRTDVVVRADVAAQRSAVVAPASDFLPAGALHIDGVHVTIRYEHHTVDAQIGSTTYRLDGRTVTYDAAPTHIGSELFLPLELLEALGNTENP